MADFCDAKIFNITGMKEGYENLQILIPPNEVGRFTGRDFDICYANYIIYNDNVFIEFFKIIQNLYKGQNVYLVFDATSDWSENLAESLLKLIQQRYGYNAYHILLPEDYLYASQNDMSRFDPCYGIHNLDIDKERYEFVVQNMVLAIPVEYRENVVKRYE
jgi:hypothetical protein